MDEQVTYEFPASSMTDFYNNFWTKYFKEHLKSCSNLPQAQGKWKAPLPKKMYTFSKCLIPSFTVKMDKYFMIPQKRQRVVFQITKNNEVVERIVATLMGTISDKRYPGYYYYYNFDVNKFKIF